MSKISIQRAHHLPHAEARNAAEQAIASLAKKYGIQSRWIGDSLHIDGGGVNGTLEVTPQQLSLNLSLGMMAAMFKSVIVDSIEEKLDAVLGR